MALILFVTIWCVVVMTADMVSGAEWDYGNGSEGPSNWKDNFPLCNDNAVDSRQSPVDIVTATAQYNSSLKAVTYTNYEIEDSNVNFELKNNGHTVVVTPKFRAGSAFPKVSYQPIGGKASPYKLIQFHFHWGSNRTVGSEHTINGKHYQIEVHFVHMNMKYTDFNVAITESDGLLVIGSFLKATNMKNHTGYQPLIEHFKYLKNEGDNRTMPSFALKELLPSNKERIYFYEGSLTTPACYRSVKWFVNDEPIELSEWQTSQFLTFMTSEGGKGSVKQLVDNYRPAQKLHSRIIMTTINPSSSSIQRASAWLVSIVFVTVGYQFV